MMSASYGIALSCILRGLNADDRSSMMPEPTSGIFHKNNTYEICSKFYKDCHIGSIEIARTDTFNEVEFRCGTLDGFKSTGLYKFG